MFYIIEVNLYYLLMPNVIKAIVKADGLWTKCY